MFSSLHRTAVPVVCMPAIRKRRNIQSHMPIDDLMITCHHGPAGKAQILASAWLANVSCPSTTCMIVIAGEAMAVVLHSNEHNVRRSMVQMPTLSPNSHTSMLVQSKRL